MSLATVDDYTAKYGAVDDEDELQVWLDDASTLLIALLGSRYDSDDDDQAAVLSVVCRDMVHRAIASIAPGFGVQSYSQGANGFTESLSYSNSTGDLYLTATEKRILGINAQAIGYLSPTLEAAGSYA